MNRRSQIVVWLTSFMLFVSCGPKLEIHDRPISFSEDRHEATLRYIAEHYGRHPEDISIEPRIIVLHWTAIDGFEDSFQAFDPEILRGSRPDLGSSEQVNVSIQFVVDRDGTVYRLMPETWMARHVIGLNYSAIGVENVGGGDSIDNLTNDQIESNIQLVRYLAEKYSSIEYLVGHSEYREFEGHALWLELDDGYRTEKVDPGDRFMTAVRKGVAGMGLQGPH